MRKEDFHKVVLYLVDRIGDIIESYPVETIAEIQTINEAKQNLHKIGTCMNNLYPSQGVHITKK